MLAQLLLTSNKVIQKAEITALVRGQDKAKVLEEQRVRTVLFQGFEDLDTIRQAANEHDRKSQTGQCRLSSWFAKSNHVVVIHTASGFDTDVAKSLIQGLADRKARLGQEVYYIHVYLPPGQWLKQFIYTRKRVANRSRDRHLERPI